MILRDLDTIRRAAKAVAATGAGWSGLAKNDVPALCDEIERLREFVAVACQKGAGICRREGASQAFLEVIEFAQRGTRLSETSTLMPSRDDIIVFAAERRGALATEAVR